MDFFETITNQQNICMCKDKHSTFHPHTRYVHFAYHPRILTYKHTRRSTTFPNILTGHKKILINIR